jgi:pilus assembly protein CpaF
MRRSLERQAGRAAAPDHRPEPASGPAAGPAAGPAREPADIAPLEARVHRRLLATTPDEPFDDAALADLVRAEAPLLANAEVAAAVARVRARIGGMGPVEPFLADPEVSDILVNGPGPVWVERRGRLEPTGVQLDRPGIDLLVERVVAPLGLRADRSSPIIDARLPDGSRVHVVLPPLAVDGPAVTIRRFGATTLPLSAFCGPAVGGLLVAAVADGRNMVVSGGTGAGKTTLLNALCRHLPAGERVVTVEDAAELRLPGDHVVRLETRPAGPDGLAAVGVRDLLRAALRMRPDRIVVGEVRGGEALDMVQAMNTGHGGCLSTCHANGPADALRRVETMALMGQADLPLAAVRAQMLGAIDLVVHVERTAGAARRVAAVAEVVAGERAQDTGPGVEVGLGSGAGVGAGVGVDVRVLARGDAVLAACRRPPRGVPRPGYGAGGRP